jgi:hypothetical protein
MDPLDKSYATESALGYKRIQRLRRSSRMFLGGARESPGLAK